MLISHYNIKTIGKIFRLRIILRFLYIHNLREVLIINHQLFTLNMKKLHGLSYITFGHDYINWIQPVSHKRRIFHFCIVLAFSNNVSPNRSMQVSKAYSSQLETETILRKNYGKLPKLRKNYEKAKITENGQNYEKFTANG